MNLLKPDSSSFSKLLDLLLSFLDGILLKDPLIPQKTKDSLRNLQKIKKKP